MYVYHDKGVPQVYFESKGRLGVEEERILGAEDIQEEIFLEMVIVSLSFGDHIARGMEQKGASVSDELAEKLSEEADFSREKLGDRAGADCGGPGLPC